MEIRKLQKTGGSSLTLTLPKKWLDLFHLNDKDEVKIDIQQFGVLVIKPVSIKLQTLRSTLSVDDLTATSLPRELIAHYISGVDEIDIRGKQITPEQRHQIRTLFQLLVGFEIIDESSTRILVKNIFDATKFPIEQSIEKMFHIAKSMVKDACNSLFTNNKLLAIDVIDRDSVVDKLYLVITRQLHVLMRNKFSDNTELSMEDLYYYEDVATQVERIADHGEKVATIVTNDQKVDKTPSYLGSSQELVKEILSLIDAAEEMVEKQDKALANKILDINEEMGKAMSPYLRLGQDITLIQLLLETSLDRIRGYIMNMAETTIDQNVTPS